MVKDNKTKITPCQAQEILNAIYAITGNNQVLRKTDGKVVFHNPHEEPIKENCPLSVPVQYVEDYAEPRERKRKDPEQVYEELYICAGAGKIPNEVLKYSLKKWVESTPVICSVINGEKRFFEGRAKSSARYNSYNYWRIHDHAKKLHSLGYKPYFLTVTNDPKPYKHDYIKAWRGFHANNGRLLKNLCRTFHAYYECVYEAQKSGNPHAHIVLWVSDFFEDDKIVKTKKKTFISDGILKRYLKKYEKGLGFMELRRGEDKDPINYLLKYISKASTKDFYSMSKDINRMKDSDRKDALSSMLPILSKVRQFTMSQHVLDKEEETSQTTSHSQGETQAPREFKDPREARDYLKTLCINFPLSCQSLVRIFTFKQLSQGTTISPRDLVKLPDERKEELFTNGKCLGCKGCIVTHFINYMNTGSDPWFDIKPKDSEEVKSKIVKEDGILAKLYEEQLTPEELAQNKSNAFEDNSLGYLPLEKYVMALNTEAERKQIESDKAIYADITTRQSIQGFSMLTNLEKFSANSTLPKAIKKTVVRKPEYNNMFTLSDERFNALKEDKPLCVYAEVNEKQFVNLFDFEYTQKIIKVKNEKTNEEIFAEFHIMNKDKININRRTTETIAVELKLSEEVVKCKFDKNIRFYKNSDLTD